MDILIVHVSRIMLPKYVIFFMQVTEATSYVRYTLVLKSMAKASDIKLTLESRNNPADPYPCLDVQLYGCPMPG